MSNHNKLINKHYSIESAPYKVYRNTLMSVPFIRIYNKKNIPTEELCGDLMYKYNVKFDFEEISSPYPVLYKKPKLKDFDKNDIKTILKAFGYLKNIIDTSIRGNTLRSTPEKQKDLSQVDFLLREAFYKASLTPSNLALSEENQASLKQIKRNNAYQLLRNSELIKTWLVNNIGDNVSNIDTLTFAFANSINKEPYFLYKNERITTSNIEKYFIDIAKQQNKTTRTLKPRRTRVKLTPPIKLYREEKERTTLQDIRIYTILSYNLMVLSQNLDIYKIRDNNKTPASIILEAIKNLNKLTNYLKSQISNSNKKMEKPEINPNFLETAFKLFENIPNTQDYIYGYQGSKKAITKEDIIKSLEKPIRVRKIKTDNKAIEKTEVKPILIKPSTPIKLEITKKSIMKKILDTQLKLF